LNIDFENCDFYHKKSFDESLGQNNRNIIEANLNGLYKHMAVQAKKIVDLISKVKQK